MVKEIVHRAVCDIEIGLAVNARVFVRVDLDTLKPDLASKP